MAPVGKESVVARRQGSKQQALQSEQNAEFTSVTLTMRQREQSGKVGGFGL